MVELSNALRIAEAVSESRLRSELFVERVSQAPAKINLRLKVLGRRQDGYHLLSMLNASTSLSDTLSIQLLPHNDVRLNVVPHHSPVGPLSQNLIVRAWTEFWNEFSSDGSPYGVQIALIKRIPIGGGLGGGSSDAGAMLRFLGEHLGPVIRELSGLSQAEFEERMVHVSLRVGADVPYSYRGGLCWVSGVGERVLELGKRELWSGDVMIVMPPVSVPTVEFYAFLRAAYPTLEAVSDGVMERFVASGCVESILELVENDFEKDVVRFRPVVGEALRLARKYYPDTTSLTGSGAAIFSLVRPDDRDGIDSFERAMSRSGMSVFRASIGQ